MCYKTYNSKTVNLYNSVKKWQRIEAKVLNKSKEINKNSASIVNPSIIYKVEYEFAINGINYKGNNLMLTDLKENSHNSMKAVDAERMDNRINETMLIYVNTNNPNESVMFCDDIIMHYVMMLIITLFSIFGFVFIYLLIVNALQLFGILNIFK